MARAYVVVLEKSLLLDRARSWDKTQAPNVQYASRYALGGGAAREMAEPRRGRTAVSLGSITIQDLCALATVEPF